jgi:hypothetical protein
MGIKSQYHIPILLLVLLIGESTRAVSQLDIRLGKERIENSVNTLMERH